MPPSYWIKLSLKSKPKDIFSRLLLDDDNKSTEHIAVSKILEKKYQDAIKFLLKTEEKEPYVYSTASNLAVAYELSGDFKSAIYWMKEALKRNPNSHYNTEWLHLYILKSELKIKKGELSLKNNLLITLPKKYNDNTLIDIDGQKHSVKDIRKALIYQLKERTIFVKPKDEIVANLFYTLAEIEANTRVVNEAIEMLKFSKLYGFNNSKLIDDKISEYQKSYIYAVLRYLLYAIVFIFIYSYLRRYIIKIFKK